MSEHNAEAEQVRNRYANSFADRTGAYELFDRWLKSIKAEAWDECLVAAEDAVGYGIIFDNPYR